MNEKRMDAEKVIEKVYQALIAPKGWRLKLLKWLFPEIREVARILREDYYWS